MKNVKPLFLTIRGHVDDLELIVEDQYTMPKYREILFARVVSKIINQ